MFLRKVIKYSTLFLIMLNLPSWAITNLNPTISSMLSYASFILMLVYFVFTNNRTLNLWMILLGMLYFSIGILVSQDWIPENEFYIPILIKYFITVIGGYEIVKNTSKKELIFFLILGALSVFLQILFYFDAAKDLGRYSGFYKNPNFMGFVCMMGYALSYGINNKKWKLLSQVVFTVVGFLTFSRTFLIVWLFINLVSIKISFKNIRVLGLGLVLILGILTFNAILPKSNPRLEAMTSMLDGKKQNTSIKSLKEDSRTQTWAIYYPALFERPIFGHGHLAFEGGNKVSRMGPHNAYIKTMGEAGILPLLLMLILYGIMMKDALANFNQEPHLTLMLMALLLFMSTNHSFWTNGTLLFFSMWLQYQIFKPKSNPDPAITIQNQPSSIYNSEKSFTS